MLQLCLDLGNQESIQVLENELVVKALPGSSMDPLLILLDQLENDLVCIVDLSCCLVVLSSFIHKLLASHLLPLGLLILYLHVQVLVEYLHLLTKTGVGLLTSHVSGRLKEQLHVWLELLVLTGVFR